MFKNDKVKIYWSGYNEIQTSDWTLLYDNPKTLFDELDNQKSNNIDKKSNIFLCPAVRNHTKNTLVIRNPSKQHIKIKKIEGKPMVIPDNYNMLPSKVVRLENLENQILVQLFNSYIFFSEDENLNMTLTSTYFSKTPHIKYGAIVPGKFNIGKWFRNINLEFNLWKNISELIIEKGEPIAYINFDTEKEIELVRFDLNSKLIQFSKASAASPRWLPFATLKDRYKLFKQNRVRDLVLKEIKNQVI